MHDLFYLLNSTGIAQDERKLWQFMCAIAFAVFKRYMKTSCVLIISLAMFTKLVGACVAYGHMYRDDPKKAIGRHIESAQMTCSKCEISQ